MLKINLFVTLLLTAFLGFGPRAWSQCSISPVGSTSQTVCQGTAITPLSFSSSGGTGAIFSGLPAGVSGSYNSLNGEITLSGTPSVAGTFSYTINMVGCSGGGSATASGSLIVTSFNTLTFVSAASTANQVFCSGTSMDSVRIRITGTTTFTTSGLPDGVTAIRRNDTIILGGTPLNGTPFLPSANDTLFTYTIDLTGGCTGGTNSISGTLRVRNNSAISLQASSNNAQTVCIGSAISSIVYKTGRANQVIFSGLPAGVSGSFDSLNRLVTLSGTPTVRGTYAYSVLVNGGCIGNPNVATGTITVQGYTVALQPTSAPINQTVCLGGTIQAITYTTSGATGIGTATGLPSGLTASWAANVLTVSGTVAASVAPGTFNFSVPMSGLTGCPGVNASGSIVVTGNRTVGAASSTPVLCIGSALDPAGITHATTIATGIGLPTGLPAGCTAVFSGNATSGTVTISGTPSAIGVYNYNIPMVGCGTANATGTITVQGYTVALRPISAPSSQTVCLGGTIQAISYSTSGATGIGSATGLPTGLTASWVGNVLTVSGTVSSTATPGTYNFSVPMSGLPSCPNVNATGSIVVTGNRTVGAASSTPTICIGSSLPADITHATTIATGIGLPTGLPAGCTAVFSGNATSGTVTITGTPTSIGVYNYTIPMVGCGNANATGTITVQGYTVALRPTSAPSSQTVCLGGTIQAISYSTSGATGIGAVTGLPTGLTATWAANVLTVSGTVAASVTPDTYNFSVPMDGLTGCPGVNATGSIVVTGNRTVGAASSTPTICIGSSLPADITHATTIATGIGLPTGLPAGCTAVFSGNATSGTVTITGTPTSIGVFNYTIPMVGCGNANATGTITVQGYTVALRPISAPSSQTVCLGGTIQAISYATTGATGIGTATGLPTGLTASWVSNVLTVSGTVDAGVTPGTFNFSVPMSGLTGCPGVNATGSIVVRPYNSISLTSGNGSPSLCLGDLITPIVYTTSGFSNGIVVTGLPQGITHSYDSASRITTISGTPSVRGVFVYRITALGGCTQNSSNTITGTITVNGNTILLGKKDPNLSTPDVVTNIQTRCALRPIQSVVFTTTGATGASLVPALPANSGLTANFNSGTGVFTISGTPSGSFTYIGVVRMSGGCTSGQIEPSVNITVLDSNIITLTSGSENQTVSRNTAMTDITFSTAGATGARFRGLPSGVTGIWAANTVTISGTPVATGTYRYIVDMVGGCPVGKGNSDTGTITVTAGGSLIGGGNGEQGFEGDDANRSNQNNASAISSGRLNSNRGLITTVTVYPVPGSDFLFVRGLASLEQTLLTIVDQTGRVVVAPHASISNDSGSSEYKLDLSSLADGVYFLRVQSATEGIDQMLRFSVKH